MIFQLEKKGVPYTRFFKNTDSIPYAKPCPVVSYLCESWDMACVLRILNLFFLDFIHGNSTNNYYDLVQDGLNYLDTRIDFWRQQEPLYARKNKKLPPKKPAQQQKPADTTKYILRSLEEIDEALADGEPEDSLKKAQSTLKTVQSLGAESVPNKAEVIGNLYSCIGNAYLEMDNYEEALKYHEKDLKAAKKR